MGIGQQPFTAGESPAEASPVVLAQLGIGPLITSGGPHGSRRRPHPWAPMSPCSSRDPDAGLDQRTQPNGFADEGTVLPAEFGAQVGELLIRLNEEWLTRLPALQQSLRPFGRSDHQMRLWRCGAFGVFPCQPWALGQGRPVGEVLGWAIKKLRRCGAVAEPEVGPRFSLGLDSDAGRLRSS